MYETCEFTTEFNVHCSKADNVVSLAQAQYYNLEPYVHNLNDVENHLKIGLYKVIFILSCGISCLIYYSGTVLFSLSAKRIREDFDYSKDEYAQMFFVGAIGGMCGLCLTVLQDFYGRAVMYLVTNMSLIVAVLVCTLNTNKYVHFGMVFLIRFFGTAILAVDSVYIQESIRANLRYLVVGVLFVIECMGLFGLMLLVKLFDGNWRYAYLVVISLGVVCLILRFFICESYKWQSRVGRPKEACDSINYCCDMQQDSFRVGYINQKALYENYGILYLRENNGYRMYKVLEYKHKNNAEFETNLVGSPSAPKELSLSALHQEELSLGSKLQVVFSRDYVYRLKLDYMLVYISFATLIFHIFIPYISEYTVSSGVLSQMEFSEAVIYSSILMLLYTSLVVLLFIFVNKRVLLLCVHAQMLLNAAAIWFFNGWHTYYLVLVNLGLILGAGRIVKVINHCLIAETCHSDKRGTVNALFMITENTVEIFYYFLFFLFYQDYPSQIMTACILLYSVTIVIISFMVYSHKDEAEELPE